MKRIVSLILSLGLCIGLFGCGDSTEKSEAAKAKEKEIIETYKETKYREENEVNLVLEVVNATNLDFSAVALLDPMTGEQVVFDGVGKEQTLTTEICWPKGEADMHWAIYDIDENLYMEGLTKLEEGKKHIILTLEGKDTVDHLETEFMD